MFGSVAGLPLHPLVVHAAVALIPLSVIGVLIYVFVPRWRTTLRWPLLVVATISALAVPAAYFTGEPFRDGLGLAQSQAVQRHEGFAQQTLVVLFFWWLAVAGMLAKAPSDAQARSRWPARWLLVVVVLLSLAGLAGIIATGHSGASSVWGPRFPA